MSTTTLALEALKQIEDHHNETEGWREIARTAIAALEAEAALPAPRSTP